MVLKSCMSCTLSLPASGPMGQRSILTGHLTSGLSSPNGGRTSLKRYNIIISSRSKHHFIFISLKQVKFPPNGTVFDFYVDSHAQEMVPWVNRVPKFELDADLPLQAVLVHTAG